MPISAYDAAAAEIIDSANLNSLASGCSAGTGEASDTIMEFDNSSAHKSHADVFINLASINITSTTAAIHLYVIPVGADGTNFPHYAVDHATAANNKIPRNYYAKSARFNVLNGAQEQVIRGVPLPPAKYRYVITNGLGLALAASGNVIKHRLYDFPSA